METYQIIPIKDGTSEDLRLENIYIDEKGDDLPPTNLGGQVNIAVEQIVGGSVMDLRNAYSRSQRGLASERYDHESDSDSDNEVSDRIQYLADEDTTWFRGCGLKFTLETSIVTTQIAIGSIIIVFCILKLWPTEDCSVVSTYAPLLSAIVMYFLSHMGSISNKRKKK